MNNEKLILKNQIKKVIILLEQRLTNEEKDSILNTIYKRYIQAYHVLAINDDIKKIKIIGSCRAYLDSYSDYMNPILSEMGEAESLLKVVLNKNI